MAETITLEVARYRPEQEGEPTFESFDVPLSKDWVVLDALNYIKDKLDGTLSYRWIRSDGTSSGVLREVVVRGQEQARLHLRWTFQGNGHRTARAELRILSPTRRTVTTQVTYDCS